MIRFPRPFFAAAKRRNLLAAALLCLALIFARPAAAATLVIDPGHGGNENGAGAAAELSEKRFVLELARAVAERLAMDHRVQLTRTADIALSPVDRTAVANHRKADLLVSLHAGVAPYCGERLAFVYVHDDTRLAMAAKKHSGETAGPVAWERLQMAHQTASRTLAKQLAGALQEDPAIERATVFTAPLAALMGADCPALLLEVGCFHPTVPMTQAQWDRQLRTLAEPLAAAIDAVLAANKK